MRLPWLQSVIHCSLLICFNPFKILMYWSGIAVQTGILSVDIKINHGKSYLSSKFEGTKKQLTLTSICKMIADRAPCVPTRKQAFPIILSQCAFASRVTPKATGIGDA